jgi:hypothetical protein
MAWIIGVIAACLIVLVFLVHRIQAELHEINQRMAIQIQNGLYFGKETVAAIKKTTVEDI